MPSTKQRKMPSTKPSTKRKATQGNTQQGAPVTKGGEYEKVPLEGGGYKRRRVGAKKWQHMCEHGKEKQKCKECGGASICEHGCRRSRCKECKASASQGREPSEEEAAPPPSTPSIATVMI